MRLFIASAVSTVFALALACAPAQAGVGFQHFSIPDPEGPPLEVGVWYPTDEAPKAERIELDSQQVAPDAAPKGDHLPLVLISHGHGGSYAGHADTAIALAEAGFVAAAVTHTGDNWRDDSGATAIWQRPRQLKVLADYMLDAWADHGRLDAGRVGAFGFSAGGFTVLTAAGAEPEVSAMVEHCRQHPKFEDCEIAAKQGVDLSRKITWTHDARIRAVVSAAPGLGFTFGRKGLAAVRQPVQLWRAADDRVLPHPFYAEAVRENLPTPPEMHVVKHAGHYDFLRPCSPALAKEVPAICASEPGFDREAFHVEFNRNVVGFFQRALK